MPYKTVAAYATDEITIEKSRFIAHVYPAPDEETAKGHIHTVSKKHWDATHNCYAYIIGERDQWQKQSDDGEPSGTAGKPILEVIRNRGLKNTVIVVTRYFGGILLGAGGLIRAYADGAVAAIEAAGPVEKVLHRSVWLHIDYTWYGKVENELRNRGILRGETKFSDIVSVECLPAAAEAEAFINWMTDLTQGQAVIESGDSRYVDHPVGERDSGTS